MNWCSVVHDVGRSLDADALYSWFVKLGMLVQRGVEKGVDVGIAVANAVERFRLDEYVAGVSPYVGMNGIRGVV